MTSNRPNRSLPSLKPIGLHVIECGIRFRNICIIYMENSYSNPFHTNFKWETIHMINEIKLFLSDLPLQAGLNLCRHEHELAGFNFVLLTIFPDLLIVVFKFQLFKEREDYNTFLKQTFRLFPSFPFNRNHIRTSSL